MPHLPIVGVMGSGTESHAVRSQRLGRWLAESGCHLLTGGGGGVMAAVSRAFFEFDGPRGQILGIVPVRAGSHEPPAGYPNPWVEIAIRTHLPLSGSRGSDALSRNHINILTSDVIVALPGSEGTSSEVRLALDYGRPVAAHLRSRSEIPNLADGVPLLDDFGDLKSFLLPFLPSRGRDLPSGIAGATPAEPR